LTDSSPLGKRNFLNCYYKARKKALSEQIIKAGWRATGLWPKSMAKPLMSPLLLENSNAVRNTPKAIESFEFRPQIDPQILLSTPRKSTEVKAQVARAKNLQKSGYSTERLLVRKIIKGWEGQESIIADQSFQIQSLQAQLEKARPIKRRKVKTSPNSKFADIQAIYQAQKEVNQSQTQEEGLEEANLSDSTIDYIEVEGFIN
jgi:hypothetical protein